MEITVRYGSGRRFGINHSGGVGVFLQRDFDNAISVELAFANARTPGDASWQASHFGNDATCDRATITIEPDVAIRLAQALLKIAKAPSPTDVSRFADEQKDRFAAERTVNRDERTGERSVDVTIAESTPGVKNPLIEAASKDEEFDEPDDDSAL